MEEEQIVFPIEGMRLEDARVAIDKLRNIPFINDAWITVKESKQHGHHIYSVESIKVEALDRIVEVVSGNTPHASSALTINILSYLIRKVNGLMRRILSKR